MAVSPDFLLNTQASATVAKPPSTSSANAPQAGRGEASSFADVYARERQGKPVERQDVAARNASGKDRPAPDSAEKGGTQAPDLAEAGNDLPLDESAALGAEAELDPLLLLGMADQAEILDEALPASAGEFLLGLPQGQLPQAVADGALETEESLLAQRSLVDTQATTQKAQLLPAQAMAEGEAVIEAKAYLSAKLLPDEMAGEEGEALSLDEDFAELLDQATLPKESRSSAAEAAPDRLNALSQAIAQQTQQAQRPVLAPGQPLNMQQPNLSEAVVDRVMWLSSQNLKSAEIQLDPAELGRMEIRIDMSKEHSQVTFLSPHAGVRETLEGQMQRLRDMFAQQGMSMDVNVSDQSAQGRQDDAESREGRGALAAAAEADDETLQGSMEISGGRTAQARGLVDFYA